MRREGRGNHLAFLGLAGARWAFEWGLEGGPVGLLMIINLGVVLGLWVGDGVPDGARRWCDAGEMSRILGEFTKANSVVVLRLFGIWYDKG